MSYKLINWENAPSTKTPINAENLKHMEEGIVGAHDAADKKIPNSDKGKPGGVADLDETGKVPLEQLPKIESYNVGGDELGLVKNGGNVVINPDGTMAAPESDWNATETNRGAIKNRPSIENGDGKGSIQQLNNYAVGDNTTSFGVTSIAGCRGYYIQSVDLTNKKIYLSEEHTGMATMLGTEDYTDPLFKTPEYILDKSLKFSVIIDKPYHACAEVDDIHNNVVTYRGNLPNLLGELEILAVFCMPSEPTIGTTMAFGDSAYANGHRVRALGTLSQSKGYETYALGWCACAEGNHSQALGDCSHSEGYYTITKGACSHSEGFETIANGLYAHATGFKTEASGNCSCTEGSYTKASSANQHVQGIYNIEDTKNKYIHIVGGGTGDDSLRANLYTLEHSTGKAWYKGSVTSNGADYAEYFEWLDGNANNEDRVGLLVTLDGDKIRLANIGDEIHGIISGTVAILGDNYECEWNGKYLTDDFGRLIYEDVEEFVDVVIDLDEETTEPIIEKKSIGIFKHPRINPNYDPAQQYINRANRPEWDAVGMIGKLYVRDDGTAEANGYITVGENGIATASPDKTNMRVLSRVNKNVVRVLLK